LKLRNGLRRGSQNLRDPSRTPSPVTAAPSVPSPFRFDSLPAACYPPALESAAGVAPVLRRSEHPSTRRPACPGGPVPDADA
jgi:hypothetical protein